jgi:selenoprotein W-related protein
MRARQISVAYYCAAATAALVVAPHRARHSARPLTRRPATEIPPPTPAGAGARVVISYCPGCKWLLRSAYFAQELLTTFDGGELREVALSPAEIAGTWTVSIDEQIVWDRKADGGFPEAKILKRRVRDVVSPDASLGHSDAASPTPEPPESVGWEDDWLAETSLSSDGSAPDPAVPPGLAGLGGTARSVAGALLGKGSVPPGSFVDGGRAAAEELLRKAGENSGLDL